MNCCDEYGNCRQGRDCPARADPLDIKTTQVFEQLGDLLIILITVVVTLVFLGTTAACIYFCRMI